MVSFMCPKESQGREGNLRAWRSFSRPVKGDAWCRAVVHTRGPSGHVCTHFTTRKGHSHTCRGLAVRASELRLASSEQRPGGSPKHPTRHATAPATKDNKNVHVSEFEKP